MSASPSTQYVAEVDAGPEIEIAPTPSAKLSLRSAISFWIAIAHSTAATTEGNSSKTAPSPVGLDDCGPPP